MPIQSMTTVLYKCRCQVDTTDVPAIEKVCQSQLYINTFVIS